MRPTSAALPALTTVLCVAAFTGTAAATPNSHAEALRQGDPAATAPSFLDDGHGAVFEGAPVSEAVINSKALACLAVAEGPSRCYPSARALERAELHSSASVSRVRPRRRPIAHAACAIWDILHIWVSADYTGSVASLEDRQRWANIGNGMNDRGSSFVMGDHSGHLAEHSDGLGYWYPGDTGVCAYENNLTTNGSGWNNRISSRYRN